MYRVRYGASVSDDRLLAELGGVRAYVNVMRAVSLLPMLVSFGDTVIRHLHRRAYVVYELLFLLNAET